MNGVNKVIIVGTLGKDPELRYTGSQKAVCNLNLATNRQWKDDSGAQHKETEWHKIVLFDRQAEVANEYLTKGSQVYIEGRLQTRKWTDKNGQDRWTTEIVGREMQFLGGGRQNQAPNQPQQQEQKPVQQPGEPAGAPPGGDFEDDIPF